MPMVLGSYSDERWSGGGVKVYESSNAEGVFIWLQVIEPDDLNEAARAILEGRPEFPTHRATVHLSAEDALKLCEQIQALVRDE